MLFLELLICFYQNFCAQIMVILHVFVGAYSYLYVPIYLSLPTYYPLPTTYYLPTYTYLPTYLPTLPTYVPIIHKIQTGHVK